jgi:hypothetical protein
MLLIDLKVAGPLVRAAVPVDRDAAGAGGVQVAALPPGAWSPQDRSGPLTDPAPDHGAAPGPRPARRRTSHKTIGLIIVCLVLFMLFNAGGLQLMGWLTGSEIYPLAVRGAGTSAQAATCGPRTW